MVERAQCIVQISFAREPDIQIALACNTEATGSAIRGSSSSSEARRIEAGEIDVQEHSLNRCR